MRILLKITQEGTALEGKICTPGDGKLIHVHVCVHCGAISRREFMFALSEKNPNSDKVTSPSVDGAR